MPPPYAAGKFASSERVIIGPTRGETTVDFAFDLKSGEFHELFAVQDDWADALAVGPVMAW